MFGISTSLKEVPGEETDMLWYPSQVQRFLREDFASTSKRCDLLIDLDPYGDKLFVASEVNELIRICELLIQRYCIPKEAWLMNQGNYSASQSGFSPLFSATCIEGFLTSEATLENPFPCSAARAALIATFKASRLVCSEITRMIK